MENVFLKGFVLLLLGVAGFLAYYLILLISWLLGPALAHLLGLPPEAGFLGAQALLGIPVLAWGVWAVYRMFRPRPES